MELKDDFLLTRKLGSPLVGTTYLSINSKKINELIKKLNRSGINIDRLNSEKTIEYEILEEERQSTVPLESRFNDKVKDIAYHLRGDGIEIILSDYEQYRSPRDITQGIKCLLNYQGEYDNGRKIGLAKDVIQEFYEVF